MKHIDNSMNIKPPKNDVNTSVSLNRDRVNGATSAPSSAANAPTNADAITLTETAGSISVLQEYLSTLPDVDNQRIAEIKAALSDGSYQVDAQKIVDNLLKSEKDLY